MAISTAPVKPGWSAENFIEWVSSPTKAYVINYLNVTVLTVGVVFLFAQFYMHLKDKLHRLSIGGLLFVPIYGVINLISYSIQISLVPALAGNALDNVENIELVAQLIQANPNSAIGFLNGLAYAILGIPSLIYGRLLIRESKKVTGYALVLNGIFCMLGVIGMVLESRILSLGVLVGGFLFLVSLGGILFEFRNPRIQSEDPV